MLLPKTPTTTGPYLLSTAFRLHLIFDIVKKEKALLLDYKEARIIHLVMMQPL